MSESMKWFKALTLENFQSHKHSHLDFVEGLNVLVGSSDAGKTAILRALKWILYNEPSGTAFISKGAKETKVILEMHDGTVISRIRSSTKNRYELTVPQKTPMIFEGFGKQVPLEIQQATGIFPIAVGSNENQMINLAEQLEGPFLLGETGSVRAMAIGKLVGVNIIDEAQQQLKRDQAGLKSQEKMLLHEIRHLDEELEPFSQLSYEETQFEEAEKICDRLDFLTAKRLTYEQLLNNEQQLRRDEMLMIERLSCYRQLESLIQHIEQIKRFNALLANLEQTYQHKKSIEAEIKSLIYEIKSYANIVNLYDDINFLKTKWSRLDVLRQLQESYLATINAFLAVKNIVDTLANMDTLTEQTKKAQYRTDRFNQLEQLNQALLSTDTAISKGNLYLSSLTHLEELDMACDKLYACNRMMDLLSHLQLSWENLIDKHKALVTTLQQEEARLRKLKVDLHHTWSKAAICPLCHQSVDEAHIHHLVDTF